MNATIIRTLFARDPDFIPAGVIPACREDGVDPEWFFPLPADTGDEAKAICHRCPVEVECADWAIRAGERHGIYGGLDPAQRAARQQAWELTA